MIRTTLAVCIALIATVGIGANVARADIETADNSVSCEVSITTAGGTTDLRYHDASDTSTAILIDPDEEVTIEVELNESTSHHVWVEFAGQGIDVIDPEFHFGPISRELTFVPTEYPGIGPGLYLIGWSAKNGDSERCKARGLFDIEGSALSDPIGIAAAGVVLLGGVGLVLLVGKDSAATLGLTFQVIFGGKVKRGEEPGWYQWISPRNWSFSTTLISSIVGFLFGVGNAVFVQKAGIDPMSLAITLQILIPSVLLPPALSSLRILDRRIHKP